MQAAVTDPGFQTINIGYDSVFQPDRMSIGLVVPLEGYRTSPVPTMQRHLERVQLAEELGFSAVWVRDVPFNVPSFGDAGQTFDPFTYLGYLAAGTTRIALGTASIILPLRHPAHLVRQPRHRHLHLRCPPRVLRPGRAVRASRRARRLFPRGVRLRLPVREYEESQSLFI